MKGMIMYVYRSADGTDCTNGGITSKFTRVVVSGKWIDGKPIPEIFSPDADMPEVKIGSNLPQAGYFHAYPADLKGDWTFGGNYIASSDSRCPKFPIPVHDRIFDMY